MLINLEPTVYLDQILHTYACQLEGQGFIEHRCHFVKMFIAIEQYSIFRSNFACLFNLALSIDWYAKNSDGAAARI